MLVPASTAHCISPTGETSGLIFISPSSLTFISPSLSPGDGRNRAAGGLGPGVASTGGGCGRWDAASAGGDRWTRLRRAAGGRGFGRNPSAVGGFGGWVRLRRAGGRRAVRGACGRAPTADGGDE
ncbi:hypothetical protein SETIT_2G005200v2 [Setaria italica]|uniref:Uncharacterized protein n=1 Tax=Setaria italica TaxID=4555 RepID=A0A368PTQ3_SETIT|nr:hypothetical protein SETIT_2G005200v2 [Setaria italica]